MPSVELRQRRRHQATSQPSSDQNDHPDNYDPYEPEASMTELPFMQANGQPAMETTDIPMSKRRTASTTSSSATDESLPPLQETPNNNNSKTKNNNNQQQQQVAKAESKLRKILTRAVSGVLLIGLFLGLMYMGHLYISLLVALVEILLFRELVRVRYHAHFHTIQDTIPFFRTTQWLWFSVAIFYTYGDFVAEIIIQGNPELQSLLQYAHFIPVLSFVLYSGTFVLTIATMQVGHIKFQLNQLCWTIVVLCLTVGQLKYIMHNIFNGLFWFALPILLVVANDIMAYVSGMTCGRKFVQRKFISLSPNKTWEGFIGGWLFTMVAAWYISRWLARFTWMTCPTNEFRLFPEPLQCELDPIFVPAQLSLPSQYFDLLPRSLAKLIPGVVEICSTDQPDVWTPCISGNQQHAHHHFELVLHELYPVQLHALWLALFASLVAPFGGFLASAIKRAYHLKDFDSLIPGHGGAMDRFDCQFLMALCTWVHYNTFVKIATISVPKLTYMYGQLNEAEKMEFLESIKVLANKASGGRGRG